VLWSRDVELMGGGVCADFIGDCRGRIRFEIGDVNFAPCCARSRAVARPIPDPAPVTTAVLPVKLMFFPMVVLLDGLAGLAWQRVMPLCGPGRSEVLTFHDDFLTARDKARMALDAVLSVDRQGRNGFGQLPRSSGFSQPPGSSEPYGLRIGAQLSRS
jgi:hypothetical protein